MFDLKALTRDAIPAALARAERYRLLNEAAEAESICLDILAIEPGHQAALITLLLAITDQFGDPSVTGCVARAREVRDLLVDDYDRAYYSGIICERRAKAHLVQGGPGVSRVAYDWLREAMDWYEKAEHLRPPGNDESILRWNACARLIMRSAQPQPAAEEPAEPLMLE